MLIIQAIQCFYMNLSSGTVSALETKTELRPHQGPFNPHQRVVHAGLQYFAAITTVLAYE